MIYSNSNIIFDLSDPSLSTNYFGQNISAFNLVLFEDGNYHKEFFTSEKTNKFNVVYTGTPGISSDAKLTLNVTEDVPDKLYYSLVKLDEDLLPEEKREYINDSDSVKNNNLISIQPSNYNGSYVVSGISTYSFECFNNKKLESNYYSKIQNEITYTTDSIGAFGPIKGVLLNSYNKLYKKEPIIKSIETNMDMVLS